MGGVEKINNEIEEEQEKEQIEKALKIQRIFMEAEVERMIKNCIKKRVPNYKHEELKEGDQVIVRLEEGKEWKGPYDVIKSGSTKVLVDVDGTAKDIGRMRVKKWNDWDDMLEEEQTKIGTKSILRKNATETMRMTRSGSKKGVSFDE